MSGALEGFRICDFTGQLAGAGATRWLASVGAEVIRIEDPVREGRWDILRGGEPFKDERRGIDLGGAFNNHNAGKFGITLNLRSDKAKHILRDLVRVSDAVTENFAAGVLDRLGFGYEALRELKPDIVYVSNCGFGHEGPYAKFKTWGPIVQAVSGLTFTSALPNQPPAGWGYSYMDHTGGYYMAMAILLALIHRQQTGEGQWVDLACTESALSLHGPTLLDWTVNGRPSRQEVQPSSNRSQWPKMAPHGIYPAAGDDEWIAISVRDDDDWAATGDVINAPWCDHERFATTELRLQHEDELDGLMALWTETGDKFERAAALQTSGVPASAVQKPQERVDQDPRTEAFGLWPTVDHTAMGEVRIDGQAAHFSETDWAFERGGPCLGEHTDQVLTELLGISQTEVDQLRTEGVV
jgi:crotonobetainyl-CoA:carnitine CoA-transferase CaiB-like acyl-CoA transferase